MDKIKEFLIKWIEGFVRNKDVFVKSIVSIEKNKQEYDLCVKHTNKEQIFFVEPFVKDLNGVMSKLKKIKDDKWISLVLVNNRANLELIIKSWKSLVALGERFSVYFVNPFSELDHKWIIFPATHDKIADTESLEKGLVAMFDSVGDISESEFLGKI